MAKSKETPPVIEAPPEDPTLAITLRTDNAYEYHVQLAKSLIADIMDPTTPTRFIEVAPLSASGVMLPGVRRFLNTLYIKEIDVRGYD
jgi:hypothetical protein